VPTCIPRTALSALLIATSAFGFYHDEDPAPVVTDAAKNFLVALTPEQAGKARFDLKDEERFKWFYVPIERKGLPLREMQPFQKHLASALLSAALSQQGYIKATTIMSLEDVLRILEKDSGERRNSEKYYFSVFGEPAEKGAWGFRVEGHHLSMNFTIVDGRIVGSPNFYGSNPAEVREGPRKGLRVLHEEDDRGRAVLASLTKEQKAVAIVSPTAYKDILTENKRTAALQGQPSGLQVSKMTAKQKEVLQKPLDVYISNVPAQLAQARQALVKKAGTNMFFAWAGVEEKGGPHYYRIQSPEFLIEYDNTQNNSNHVHAVWREMKNDFGDDMLAQHYKTSAHDHK